MGIKSLNKNESYYNFFGASGVDAVNPEPYIAPIWYGDRGIYTAGYAGPALKDTIEYIDITSTGNATDFGNLANGTRDVATC